MSILTDTSSSVGSVLDPIAAKIKNPFNRKVNNGSRPQDFPGGFFIAEIVDGVIDEGTLLQFIGNMMPFQPFVWSGEQRIVKESYPGSPESVGQVLGGKEGDLVIKGRFKDKRFKDPSLYGVAYEYAKACDEMRKRGNLVKFGMHGADSWIRYGFIEKVSFEMKKLSWIDYEISFFVVSDKQPKNNYFATPDKNAPSSVNNNLINAAASFQSKYSAIPSTMPQSIAGVLNGIISDVATNINTVTNFVGTIISTAADIQASANRALGLIKHVRTTIAQYKRQIGAIAHGFNSLSTAGNPVGKVGATYKNISFKNDVHASLHDFSSYLSQLQAQIEKIAKTVPIARYKVTDGDTLQRVASKFYGSAENWKLIYDHNKLQSTVLVAGKILEIPRA